MSTQQIAIMTPAVEVDSTQRVWPTYDHDIGLTEAREMIGRWKRANPDKPSASATTKVALERVLGQDGCVGVRAYFACNADMTTTLVYVGVDEFGNDMDDGELAERSFICPPFCPMDSALDS
jgi:hypothetical protein